MPYIGITRAQVRAVREGISDALHARDEAVRSTIRPEDFYRYQVYDGAGPGGGVVIVPHEARHGLA